MPRSRDVGKVLRALRAFYRSERRMPTYAEAMGLLGYRSKHSVYRLMQTLEEMGYVRRGVGGRLGFTDRLTGSIRLLGSVQAGFPSPAEEELADVMSLDEYLIRRPEATFMLSVTGDSMIDAGIHPGDIVLVERGREPKSGEIVVAQVDGEWTLKYYRKDRKGLRLEPANAKYQPIVPRQTLTIGGIVCGVVRKYERKG
ncbi:MAG: repressor LexA [Verrucomicrobia bacterium]|nr:transcriptional repressor LexA [Kiritimatiellia bacterium]MCP5488060.1 repressor LexA [Verrucomicrobiota bacterium]